MDYKTEAEKQLAEGKYLEYYNTMKKYHNETQTEASQCDLNRARKKYELYKELCNFLKKDENNYYEVLNIKKDATKKEIRDSYTKLISLYHPDRTKIKESNSVSRIIHKAYVILNNVKKRQEYDESLERKSTVHFRMGSWNNNFQEQIYRPRNMYNQSVFHQNYVYQGDEYTILNNILYRHFYRYTPNRRLERVRWDDQVFAKIVILILLSYFILFV